jgi:DNA-binding GntR family transcriptional regulator
LNTEDNRPISNMEFKSITESLVNHLRSQIITGEMSPGQKLNEQQLSSSLGFSRPPLREAFRTLEHDHLIVSIPRKGTYVTNLTIEDFEEVYETREMIECYAVDILKAKQIRDLPHVASALVASSRLSMPQNNEKEAKVEYFNALVNYHIKLVKAAGNGRLIHFYNAISFNLARYQFVYFYVPGTSQHSITDHQQILDLIIKGDYSEAKECLRAHIRHTADVLRSRILQDKINEGRK